MEEKKIGLSIIILSHNSKEDLKRLLPSVFGSRLDDSYEVIIVDNGSKDSTVEWLTERNMGHGAWNTKIIRNQNNGFAAGNNLGIKQAKGKYVLILNPDTELKPDTLQVMVGFMDAHQEVGISTCKVLLPNGKLDLACRRRFPNPWNSFSRFFGISKRDYNMLDTDENQSMEIDSCMGAFMMIRTLPTTNHQPPTLFDEAFFMYGEDIDLCWRMKELGYKVWYYPGASITHYKGSSSAQVPFKALKWFHEAMWIFYKKHYQNRYPFILNLLVWLGIQTRFAFLTAINFFRAEKFVSKR